MTGKEKIETAFSTSGTSEIGAVIPYEDIFIRDHWASLTEKPWWQMHSPDLEVQALWHRDIIKSIGQDWLTLPYFMPRKDRESFSIIEREDGIYRLDKQTGVENRLHEPTVSGWSGADCESYHPDQIIETIEELDKRIPETAPIDLVELKASGVADLSDRLLSEHGDDLFPICRLSSPLWSSYGVWGFEDFMTMIATQPELVEFACNRYLSRRINEVRMAAMLGAKGIWIEECLMDMIAPSQYASMNVPVMARLVEEIEAAGMKSIHYYCGNPMDRLDEILSVGADALALEEGKKGFTIDISEIADRVGGRCTLLGNLDSIGVLQNGSDADLRQEIERQIEAGRRNGGRFIMSLGSPVTPETPVDRVRLYCDMAHEIGSYGPYSF